MGKGGGGGSSTNFKAGAVPQSLYGLGGDINYFRQHDLEPLLSAPQSLTNWALNAAGVPVQQTTPAGSLYNIQTYGGAGDAGGGGTYATGGGLPSGGQWVGSAPPPNPWAGKTAGNYGDTTPWYNWINQNVGKYVYINGQPVQVQANQASMVQISQAQANGTLASSQTGANPYYQQASNFWTQLGQQAQNLIGQGNQEYQTGTGIVGTGQGLVSQGQGAFNLGQNLVNQGVSGAYTQGVQQLQSIISQYPEIESQLNQLPSYKAIMSTGLTPEQQAYVTQATQAQQAAVTQQLQSEGLGSSTMMAEKIGAAKQAGAATAGSLIQGNIQAATQAANAAANAVQERINQEQQKVGVGQNLVSGGLGLAGVGINQQQAGTGMVQAGTGVINAGVSEQSLGLNSQSTGDNYLNTVATANISMQQQLFSEAMQGYGILGQLLSQQMSVYGLQLTGEQIKGVESGTAMQAAVSAQNAANAADAQGFSGLLTGIGSLLGGKSGILGGGLTSLFGGGAAAGGAAIAGGAGTAVGGAAAGAAGGAAAGGSALTAIGAVFAAFCAVGQEIFGVENPEWFLMRDVMLFRAPKWFRKLYIRHAADWALELSERPLLKRLVRRIVRRILATLTHAQSGFLKIK